jgi:hypothetical protein
MMPRLPRRAKNRSEWEPRDDDGGHERSLFGIAGNLNRHKTYCVWLFPATYILHLCEEYFVAGGFPLWAQQRLRLHFGDTEFVAWNAFALVLMCVGAWLASRHPKFRFIEIALAVAVLGNVLAHVFGTLTTRTYSPGLLTGVALWIPLGVYALQSAWAASTSKARRAGIYIGLSVVLITMAAVAARAMFGR